jgi:biotin transport system substrate-specific component
MMTRVALMAALTAVAAQIVVPIPPVPFTMQVLAVLLSGFLLGPRYGALAQAVYLLLGAAGLPVFFGFSGGLGHFLTPTGGYLVAYPLAAALAGLAAGSLARGRRRRASKGFGVPVGIACGLLALVPIYGLGAAWLAVQSGLTPGEAIAAGVLPFVPLDALKAVMAALLAAAIAPQINAQRSAVGGHRP